MTVFEERDDTGKLVGPGESAGVVNSEDAGKLGDTDKFQYNEHAREFTRVVRMSLFARELAIRRIRFLNTRATSAVRI